VSPTGPQTEEKAMPNSTHPRLKNGSSAAGQHLYSQGKLYYFRSVLTWFSLLNILRYHHQRQAAVNPMPSFFIA